MVPSLNLDVLQSFLVFADKLNFTHAAEELHISQPALHMKIQELSDAMGVTLYRKIGRRLELTEHGKRLARFSRDISHRKTVFLNELITGSDNEPVILAAGEGAYLYILGESIKEFLKRKKHPLSLLTLNREGILDAIQSGKAHIGVAPLESISPPGVESTPLLRVDQVLILPSSHPLATKKKLQLKDLDNCKLIVPPADRPHRQMLSAALQSAGVTWEIAVEVNGWELMLHFAKLGLGLAIVNSMCTIPRGLVARPLIGLPSVHYHLFNLAGACDRGAQAELKRMILKGVQ